MAALGIYSRAYFLMLQPLSITNQLIARVMFPLLVSLKNDVAAIKRIYLKATRLIAFVVFPFVTFTFVAAKSIILLLLGNKWIEVATLLQVFCIYCLIDTIGITTAWIYKVTGRTGTMFKWGIYNAIVIIAAIIIGLQWGILGVAIAYTLSFLIFLWIPGWYFAYRIIDLTVLTMLKNLSPVFLCCLPMGIAMFFTSSLLDEKVATWLICLLTFITGFSVYILLSAFFLKENYAFIKSQINTRVNKLIHKRKVK